MLRDDAIKDGLIKPTSEDRKRMGLENKWKKVEKPKPVKKIVKK